MVEFSGKLIFRPKPIAATRVSRSIRTRNFYCDDAARPGVRRAKDRRHAAGRDQALDSIVIEQIPGTNRSCQQRAHAIEKQWQAGAYSRSVRES